MEWISVKDREPHIKNVIFLGISCNPSEKYHTFTYYSGPSGEYGETCCVCIPTHWVPLPEPPK